MGLDQHAFARKGDENIEIMYWRKHADLQGWMGDLWTSRGNTEDLNCKDLALSLDDITALEVEHRSLVTAVGFFWGQSSGHNVESTQDFINEAKERLVDGYEIIYTSWY
jgi:hypothetical protein